MKMEELVRELRALPDVAYVKFTGLRSLMLNLKLAHSVQKVKRIATRHEFATQLQSGGLELIHPALTIYCSHDQDDVRKDIRGFDFSVPEKVTPQVHQKIMAFFAALKPNHLRVVK